MRLDAARLARLAQRASDELMQRILPFWLALEDREHGGHYARVSFDGAVDRSGPKSAVFTARLLWFMSEVHRVFGHAAAADQAKRTKRFLLDRLEDATEGGLLWSVSADGRPLDEDKHVYAQAFGIYGLSACARALSDPEAAAAALRLFRKTMEKAWGPYGFAESFDRHWRETPNRRLSSGTSPAPRTMNTHLHMLEALTLLASIDVDPAPRITLAALLGLLLDRFLSADRTHSLSFLDGRLAALPAPISYGHDIEASWLIDAAADALADRGVAAEARAAAGTLARATIAAAQMDDGGFITERGIDGEPNPWRVWWVQAEALVGLINEAERGGGSQYLDRAERLWGFIAARIADPIGGEWHFRVGPDGAPDRTQPKVEPWKEPYHQGRACLELIERAKRCGNDSETPLSR